FDVVVVGGGIYGACVAWEAVLRGLSVALVEQCDFGWGTSSNMHRIAHGGFRYLQNADIKRMRESIRERKNLIRIAPHLVHPLPFLVPTYRRGLQQRRIMRVALKLYDLVAFDRNKGILDPQKRIPAGRLVSRAECLRLVPSIAEEEVTGGAVWYDGKIDSPDRLTLEFVRSAVEEGACVANYVRVTGVLEKRSQIRGVRATDLLTGRELDLQARLIINATGPWMNSVLDLIRGGRRGRRLRFIRSINVVTRPLTNDNHGVAVKVPHRGVRNGVHDGCCLRYFIVPWRGRAIAGSLDVLEHTDPDTCEVRADELEGVVERINAACPRAALTPDEVSRVHVGLLPLAEKGPQQDPYNAAQHYQITDHKQQEGIEGFISVVGVKYTTARDVAQKAVDLALTQLALRNRPSRSAETPLFGGHIEELETFVRAGLNERPHGLDEDVIQQLIRNHGSDYHNVLRPVSGAPHWGQRLSPTTTVLQAQVVYAVREEMAQKLADVVLRRTELGVLGHPGSHTLRVCAKIMAQELGWSSSRAEQELDETEALFVRAWARPPREEAE
ncbi:MAG: glycerol-3-phosphate dehydrogenase/oxidase, partial [Acidiferrobacterales bacterium]